MTRVKDLLDRARSAVDQFLGAPPPARTPRPSTLAREQSTGVGSQEVLAGVCQSVALRDLNLVDSLLAQLEKMEANEQDPDALQELYRLDHLATRLRRNAENLRVLSGRETGEAGAELVTLVDVVRAAMSSIEQYPRVNVGKVVSLGVVGCAADAVERLLAELLDNATNQSPPLSPVRVSAHLTENASVLVRIEDEGIGLPPERLEELNDRLSSAPTLDKNAVQHMGLAVVRRLASKHKMRVWLDRRTPHGTTASVVIPAPLVSDIPESSWSGTDTSSSPHIPTTTSVRAAPKTDTAAVTPHPAASREEGPELSTTPSGLPRRPKRSWQGDVPSAHQRSASSPNSSTSPNHSMSQRSSTSASKPAADGKTINGLPRRTPRSLKNPGAGPSEASSAKNSEEADDQAGREQFIADLGAFADGEQAAREERVSNDRDQESEGHQQ